MYRTNLNTMAEFPSPNGELNQSQNTL